MVPNKSERIFASRFKELVRVYMEREYPISARLTVLIGEMSRECYFIENGEYPPDPIPVDKAFIAVRSVLPEREKPSLQ